MSESRIDLDDADKGGLEVKKDAFDGFTVNIFFDKDGYYQAQLMEFPSVSASGPTPAKAFHQLKTAWELTRDWLRKREKHHAVSVLEFLENDRIIYEYGRPPQIDALSEQVLLDVFSDETSSLTVKYRAALILLTLKECTRFVPIYMEFLNFIVNAELDMEDLETWLEVNNFSCLFLDLTTMGAYEEVKDFTNYLLTENPRHKNLFIYCAIVSLTELSLKLNRKDAIPMLKSAISHTEYLSSCTLIEIAEYFDKFKDIAGIKEILTKHLTDETPDVETKCLALLQKHDPDFVEQWKAQKTTVDTENEESE